jgi:hypothetical protein
MAADEIADHAVFHRTQRITAPAWREGFFGRSERSGLGLNRLGRIQLPSRRVGRIEVAGGSIGKVRFFKT